MEPVTQVPIYELSQLNRRMDALKRNSHTRERELLASLESSELVGSGRSTPIFDFLLSNIRSQAPTSVLPVLGPQPACATHTTEAKTRIPSTHKSHSDSHPTKRALDDSETKAISDTLPKRTKPGSPSSQFVTPDPSHHLVGHSHSQFSKELIGISQLPVSILLEIASIKAGGITFPVEYDAFYNYAFVPDFIQKIVNFTTTGLVKSFDLLPTGTNTEPCSSGNFTMVCPDPRQNHFIGSTPGEPGIIICSSPNRLPDGNPLLLFREEGGVQRYLGYYLSKVVRVLSKEEFWALGPSVMLSLAEEFVDSTSTEHIPQVHASSAPSSNSTGAKKQKLPVLDHVDTSRIQSISDVMHDFMTGKEQVSLFRLQCVGYDRDFRDTLIVQHDQLG
ncbi:hypothetical protein JAAARDRAFT_59881 [Jaapia argillacea MUCL 33604]|uniref:DUF6697 domain-containing protein n=1 Tax=Jaapia argillacea MUCL 33604 TaxID=933084 RepID=A0A067PYF2_9AGAM|nr:hypothetical protein JAAARDRAFT_59881 [Jaapia argillacea MUCL 33604]